MKKQVVFLLVFTLICESWSIPKPMESVDNYNILMVHGAYGASKVLEIKTLWNHA